MENNTNQLNSMLCKRNCGFFGNAAYDGYCSKCYKDHVKRQNSGSAAGRVTPTDINQSTPAASSSTITSTISTPTPITPVISAPVQTTTTATTAPIPIPSKSNIKSENTTEESMLMSVPSESNLNSSSALSANVNMASSCASDASGSLTSTSLTSSSIGSEKKKRTRCCVDSCKRKVGLTGFDCRCGGLFCWEHRYSDKHDCKFDYKELGQDQIRKNNPIVVGEKIQKI